jgi:hypothetical protein
MPFRINFVVEQPIECEAQYMLISFVDCKVSIARYRYIAIIHIFNFFTNLLLQLWNKLMHNPDLC